MTNPFGHCINAETHDFQPYRRIEDIKNDYAQREVLRRELDVAVCSKCGITFNPFDGVLNAKSS